MMNKVLIVITFCLSTLSFSQDKGQIGAFYKQAIRNHIKKLSNDINMGNSQIKLKDLYFVAENIPMKHLPKEVKGYKINYLDVYNRKNKKALKKGIWVVSVQPVNITDNKVIVTLIDFKITYKHRNYDFSNGGGSKTYFEYLCSDEKWKFLETNHTGL